MLVASIIKSAEVDAFPYYISQRISAFASEVSKWGRIYD